MPEVYAAPQDYAFPRNFKGYGEKGLEGLKWPNNAKIAVSFVINYEEVGDYQFLLPQNEYATNNISDRVVSAQYCLAMAVRRPLSASTLQSPTSTSAATAASPSSNTALAAAGGVSSRCSTTTR
jgi:hypothetical protein